MDKAKEFFDAVSERNIPVIKDLLKQGLDVNIHNENDHQTPLHVAANNGHFDTVRILIDAKAKVNDEDDNKRTPLHEAASNGHHDTVKILIAANADVNAKDRNGNTPLHEAASNGSKDTVKILTDARANVNSKNRRRIHFTVFEDTPLHQAARGGHSDTVKILIDAKANINAKNHFEETPLHEAAREGHSDTVKTLIDSKADINAKEQYKRTPIYLAAIWGHSNTVKVFVDAKADINAKDEYEETPLHVAVKNDHCDTMKILLDAKVDINAKDENQDTPLHIATSEGNAATMKILIDAKADVNAQNKNQDTPLHIATSDGNTTTMTILIDAKADVNTPNKNQETPLHIATSEGNTATMTILIDAKADVNAQNKNQDTPLHIASSEGNAATMKILIDAKADVNTQNKVYNTPLHEAVIYNHVGAIIILLESAVDFTIKNKDGKTAEELGIPRAKKVFKDVFEKVPKEIKRLGTNAVGLFLKSLSDDAVPSNVIRCMFVGHFGVGKTTLVNSLLGLPRKKTKSTNGIDLHMGKIFVNTITGKWHVQDKHSEKMFGLEEYIQIDVWDFAGQLVFYTTHQTHLSPRCFYFLVFDVVLGLKGMVDDDSVDPSDERKRLVEDYIDFWVASITTYAQSDVQGFPKIAIVGTHVDKLTDTSIIPEIIQKIQTKYQTLVNSGQLIVREDLFVNAFNMDEETTKKLREMIIECGGSYPEYGKMIPRSWNNLHEQLIRRKSEKLIGFRQLQLMNRQLNKSLEEEELIICMKYLHSLGYLLFFPEEELKDHIILDPRWIIDAMKCFITCSTFALPFFRKKKWLKMQSTGKITHLCFDEVLMRSSSKASHLHHLHRVMKKLDLVSEPKVYNAESFEETPDYYYIPCMVNTHISDDALNLVGNEDAVQLSFVFNTVIPPAVYNRLIASSLSLWPVFKGHIYSGLVILRSGPLHVIAFRREYKQINVSVVHLEDQTNINTCLCRTIEQFVEESLPGIISIYNSSTKKSRSLFHITYQSDAAKRLQAGNNEEGEADKCVDYDGNCKCAVIQTTTYELDDLFLMRVALKLEVHHLYPLAAIVHNRASVVENLEADYPELKKSDLAWLILMDWSRRVKNEKRTPKLEELRCVLDEAGINAHILCKIIQLKDEHPFRLNTAFQNTAVRSELLDAVADRVSNRYIHVGLELGLKADDILNVRMDFRTTTVKLIRDMLQKWYDKTKGMDRVNVVNLATALLNANCDISVLYEFEKQRIPDIDEKNGEEAGDTGRKCCIS